MGFSFFIRAPLRSRTTTTTEISFPSKTERRMNYACLLYFQKERDSSVKSVPQQNADSDIWVPDYLAPSWVCLPNNQPVLVIVHPGDTALDVLGNTCGVSHRWYRFKG